MSGIPSTVAVPIADTIVFEHNCPRSWFFFDTEIGEIRRHVGRDLQAVSLFEALTSHPPQRGGRLLDVVATYTYVFEDPTTEDNVVSILYLDRRGLENFLTHPHPVKRQGMLQQFVVPLDSNECVLQAVWSPSVCILRRRTSLKPLFHTLTPVAERLVTFDGPESYSLEGVCSPDTVDTLNAACASIAEHLLRTQHMKVAAMTLYFKMTAKCVPCLLWCGNMQFQGLNPANLGHVAQFSCSALPSRDETFVDRSLRQVNEQQSELERQMSPQSPGQRRRDAAKLARANGALVSNNIYGGSGKKQAGAAALAAVADVKRRGSSSGANARSGGAVVGGVGRSGSGAGNGGLQPLSGSGVGVGGGSLSMQVMESKIAELTDSWYTVGEDVEEEYRAIRDVEQAAQTIVEDTLYMAMSHFQVDPEANGSAAAVGGSSASPSSPGVVGSVPGGGLRISFPIDLQRFLDGTDNVAQLVRAIGLIELDAGEYLIQRSEGDVALRQHPIPTMVAAGRVWIASYFASRITALQQRASLHLQIAAVKIGLAAATAR